MAMNITRNLYRNSISGLLESGASGEPVFGESGGSLSSLRWSASSGLADGNEIIVDTSAFAFSTPETFNFLGFGTGWMYSNSIGTQLQSHNTSTALGNKYWDYEYDATPNREIVLDGGVRHLRAKIWASTGTNFDAAGMVNFNIGRASVPGDRLIQYSRGKCSVGVGGSNDNSFQMKDERHGYYKNLETNSNNSLYIKHYGGAQTLDLYRHPPTSIEDYFDRGINKKGNPYTHLFQNKQNTPGVADGAKIILSADSGSFSGAFKRRVFDTLDQIPSGGDPETFREIKWQGFCANRGHNGDEPDQYDVIWDTTDFFGQLNGSIFVIANHATISSTTQICPLIPTEFTSSTEWKLRLWRGAITTGYDTCYLHLLDSNMLSVAAKQLQNGVA